jgi:Fe2+ transport system protein FeoA
LLDISCAISGVPIAKSGKQPTAAGITVVTRMNEQRAFQERPERRPMLLPLSRARRGVSLRVKELSAPNEIRQRLREIGLCEDQVVRLIASHSNIICSVCNARLALSFRLADFIMVEALAA